MPPKPLSRILIALYLALLALCAVAFLHGDLRHTVGSSYALLNGHVHDFYDYNVRYFERNDYLPGIYVIFAAWMLPLKLAGTLSDVSAGPVPPGEALWGKLLLIGFFLGTVVMLWKVASQLFPLAATRRRVAWLMATSPMAIFSVCVMGQSDVVGCFFVVCGLYFYFRREFNRFALMFALAIPVKYFPVAIFVPLLLLAPVNWLSRIRLALVGLSFTAAQFALCAGSATCRKNILFLPLSKTGAGGTVQPVLLGCLAGYVLLCLLLLRVRPADDAQWQRRAVMAGAASTAFVFAGVAWHPQWFVLAAPFVCLACGYLRRPLILLAIEAVGVLAFTWVYTNTFAWNVDVTMLQDGLFADHFSQVNLAARDLMPVELLPVMKALFILFLFGPAALLVRERAGPAAQQSSAPDSWIAARFAWCMAIVLGPLVFCAFVSESVARAIEPQAALYNLRVGMETAGLSSPTGEILASTPVVQGLRPEENNLAAVSVRLSTYGRLNAATVRVSLFDEGGRLIAGEAVPARRLHDHSFYGIAFAPIGNSAGRTFHLAIESPDALPGHAITAWKTNVAPPGMEGQLTMAGQPLAGVLNMRLQYSP